MFGPSCLLCFCTLVALFSSCHGFVINKTFDLKSNPRKLINKPSTTRSTSGSSKRFLFNGSNSNGGSSISSRCNEGKKTVVQEVNEELKTPNISGGISGGLQLQQLRKEWFKSSNIDKDEYNISINSILDKLEQGSISLPYKFEYKDRGFNAKRRTVVIRQMELNDLQRCVAMCLREYGKYPSLSSSVDTSSFAKNSALMDTIKSKIDDLDNFVFSFVVLLGLEQRVNRRIQGDKIPSLMQDHNVILLSEIIEGTNNDDETSLSSTQEFIFGMAEISLQPPDPSRTSPPFVIPTNIKNIMTDIVSFSKPYNSSTSKSNRLCAYVSNVLISNEYRSKGYSKILMAACHGIAKSWGFESTFLHVDADATSGKAAQQLYRKLGYKPFVDKSYNEQFAWMGIETVNRGLYIVDGVPLLFLKKDFK